MKKSILAALFISSAIPCFGMDNVHKVDDKLYRSALPTNKKKLKKIIKDNNIKKVLAFTHKNETEIQKWINEIEDVTWKFLTLSSSDAPSKDDFKPLVEFAKILDYVILCYDKDNQNRTGFFSALHILLTSEEEDDNTILNDALDQFSFKKYGYIILYHRLCSSGGINFLEKFGKCYLKVRSLIKEKGWDAKKLSTKEKDELEQKLKKDTIEKYLDYALIALT